MPNILLLCLVCAIGADAASSASPDEIRALIRGLAEVEEPDIPTTAWEALASPFPAPPWSEHIVEHRRGEAEGIRNEAMRKLVILGPQALPYLLDSLDDGTPTRAVFDFRNNIMGGMSYGQRSAIRKVALEAEQIQELLEGGWEEQDIASSLRVPVEFVRQVATLSDKDVPRYSPLPAKESNPLNEAEQMVLSRARQELLRSAETWPDANANDPLGEVRIVHPGEFGLQTYTLAVGDVCYIIIGLITNRSYLPAQYQPTGNIVIQSPTRDNKLREDVRAVWRTENPSALLLESLLRDFDFEQETSEELRYGAALRLSFFYPEESSSLFLKQLRAIASSTRPDSDDPQAEHLRRGRHREPQPGCES